MFGYVCSEVGRDLVEGYTRRVARKASPPAEERLAGLVTVLDYVRTHGSTTRPSLVEATGLSRAVVTQRVGELLDYGLLVEGELGRSTGGRAPRLLRFPSDAGHLLVADLGATSVDVALADLSGTILAHVQEPCDIADGPERVLARVEELFVRILVSGEPRPGSLWGIGIGVPGPVEFDSGRPIAPPIMPGWDRYAVRERFARYHVPVWVDNDVNIMALGERRAGIARGHDNVVFIKIGTGIGAGIVVKGRLHRGAQGCAGDVGHMQVTDDPAVVCRCGNVGCLEALAVPRRGVGGEGIAGGARRRPRCDARRSDLRGARDPCRPAGRPHARERGQLLQPVAHRHRRRRCRSGRPVARDDP
jgi:hypothetical protein